jgi:hypothetical protein
VTSVTYEVTNKNYDLTLYDPYFETPMGLCELEGGFNGMWEVPIYRLINYTVDDGFYDISLIPRGVISLEGNEISLPEQIDFTIHIEDDRTISIILDN